MKLLHSSFFLLLLIIRIITNSIAQSNDVVDVVVLQQSSAENLSIDAVAVDKVAMHDFESSSTTTTLPIVIEEETSIDLQEKIRAETNKAEIAKNTDIVPENMKTEISIMKDLDDKDISEENLKQTLVEPQIDAPMVSGIDIDKDTDDDSHEEDIMKEILEMQQKELEAHLEELDRIKNDHVEATEAEAVAKQAEAAQAAEILRLEREAKGNKNKQSNDAWVRSSRPGSAAKPGAKLGQTPLSAASRSTDNRRNRGSDRVPESLRESSSRGKGNYFGGQTAADREEENKKRERQKKDQEKDTMSSGAGDRRRELEAKLSPQMRAQAAAEYQKRNEKEQERIARTVRYSMPRKFARPVEKILNAYNSDKTTLYDILQVRKSVSDTGLKKAYKSKALSTHPDKNIHPDSKAAFEAIQEAFETLSSPVKRNNYDKDLRKRTGRSSIKKSMRYLRGEIQNIISRMQLFWVRVFKRGEAELEYKELIGNRIDGFRTSMWQIAEHLVLLPSILERLRLVSEMSFDSRNKLLLGCLLISSLC